MGISVSTPKENELIAPVVPVVTTEYAKREYIPSVGMVIYIPVSVVLV
jgi:hypothetical protein